VLKKRKRGKVPKGYYEYLSSGSLLAAVWYDRRFVYFVSTLHKAERDGDTIPRHAQDGSIIDVPCPPLLPDYQQYMRDVDRGDQLIGCYNMGRRSKKWWKRAFSYPIECSLLNAYILEKYAKPHLYDESNKGRDFLSFTIDVAHQLIGSGRYREKAGRPPSGDHAPESRLDKDLGHWPVQQSEKQRCIVCTTKRAKLNLDIRHETRLVCSKCNVHLCVDEERQCFKQYHTKEKYWL